MSCRQVPQTPSELQKRPRAGIRWCRLVPSDTGPKLTFRVTLARLGHWAASGFPRARFYRQRTGSSSPTFLFPAILACIPT